MQSRAECIRAYLRAKDESRPHLMRSAFAASARLEVKNETDAISFPPVTTGLDAITKVLVRDFASTYENFYTLWLSSAPGGPPAADFRCGWIVGMSEKMTGAVRVGCGSYDWAFQREEPYLVQRLVISIKIMRVLPPVG